MEEDQRLDPGIVPNQPNLGGLYYAALQPRNHQASSQESRDSSERTIAERAYEQIGIGEAIAHGKRRLMAENEKTERAKAIFEPMKRYGKIQGLTGRISKARERKPRLGNNPIAPYTSQLLRCLKKRVRFIWRALISRTRA